MVVEGDPVDHLILGQTPRAEAHTVEPFNFQRAKQRLGHSVVPAIALAAHRVFHFERGDELAVIVAGILAAAIRVEDQAGCRVSAEPGHAQGVHHQRARHALAHRKADYQPIEQIDHHGKIEPALFGPDIGDGACPDLVRCVHGEVACQQVRRHRQIMRAVRGCLEPALATGTQAAGLHHFAHTLLARPDTACGKLAPNPRPAIGALHLGKDRLDMHRQRRVAKPAQCWEIGRLVRINISGLPQSVLMVAAVDTLSPPHKPHSFLLELKRIARPYNVFHS